MPCAVPSPPAAPRLAHPSRLPTVQTVGFDIPSLPGTGISGYRVTSLSDVCGRVCAWTSRPAYSLPFIGVFPSRTRGFLLPVTTAYCRKGRPFIMLGRPLSFALESEGRGGVRPFDFAQGRHPTCFAGAEFSSTGPEGRHIKAQCFSTGKAANYPESRSRGAAKGRNMNIAMCRPFARDAGSGTRVFVIASPALKRWALIYLPCRGRAFSGYRVTSLSDVWQCRAGHPDRRIRCH